MQAFALDVDPGAREWRVAAKVDGPPAVLALARVARVTLDAPLRAHGSPGDAAPHLPVAALECEYVLRMATGQLVLRGRTLDHVETDDGFFLFAAQADELALHRVFVPRASHLSCEFGATAGGGTAPHWIADPTALRTALSSQRGKRVPRIGEALQQLGFVSRQQVEQALAQTGPPHRLGERLLAQGLLQPEELQAALAFKLGYPLVDLAHFPIDPACARLLPSDLARRHGALPILQDGRQLVVAVDGPATMVALESLNLWPGRLVTPALATRSAILLALARLRDDDAWAQEAPWR